MPMEQAFINHPGVVVLFLFFGGLGLFRGKEDMAALYKVGTIWAKAFALRVLFLHMRGNTAEGRPGLGVDLTFTAIHLQQHCLRPYG